MSACAAGRKGTWPGTAPIREDRLKAIAIIADYRGILQETVPIEQAVADEEGEEEEEEEEGEEEEEPGGDEGEKEEVEVAVEDWQK